MLADPEKSVDRQLECPSCRYREFVRMPATSFVAFSKDYVCRRCVTRFPAPTPLWAAIVFMTVGVSAALIGLLICYFSVPDLDTLVVIARAAIFNARRRDTRKENIRWRTSSTSSRGRSSRFPTTFHLSDMLSSRATSRNTCHAWSRTRHFPCTTSFFTFRGLRRVKARLSSRGRELVPSFDPNRAISLTTPRPLNAACRIYSSTSAPWRIGADCVSSRQLSSAAYYPRGVPSSEGLH